MPRPRFKSAPAVNTPPPRVAPVLELKQCAACTRLVPLLVEGTDLCIRCDHLHFPGLVVA